jgi:endonuclease YncB( thermonuclease family)
LVVGKSLPFLPQIKVIYWRESPMIWRPLFLALTLAGNALAGDAITGAARIVDGDTLAIGDVKIRLEGIDAPETDQVCLDAHAAKWACGVVARDRLIAHIDGRPIECSPTGTDRYGRTLAVCSIAGENLNAWMVREGWALAFVRYSIAYVKEEEKAHTAQRGLWSGAFIAPWDWRHRDKGTTILGPLSVPITAQKQLLEPVSAESGPSHDCIIKGNVNREGERIYHMPGGNSYAKINMDAPGKRWFCTEEEAKAAGWRRASR